MQEFRSSWPQRGVGMAVLFVAVGALTAGCAGNHRAATTTIPSSPASTATAAGSVPSPAASAPLAGSTGTPSPASSASAGATGQAGAAAGTAAAGGLTAQDNAAITADEQSIDQSLNDMQNSLGAADQATSEGDSDVPSN